VVEEQPAWVVERLPTIAQAWDEAKAALEERAREKAERQSKGVTG
jgi:hypothetical protein